LDRALKYKNNKFRKTVTAFNLKIIADSYGKAGFSGNRKSLGKQVGKY